ncbi:hypothetical protein ACJ77P_06045 [Syntrophus buswellii]|uniref:hypothetical protein n=1 Tax=Syntrophus TaxID=43773 RepID=UPI00345E5367
MTVVPSPLFSFGGESPDPDIPRVSMPPGRSISLQEISASPGEGAVDAESPG